MARCMLHGFRAEVISTAKYVRNRGVKGLSYIDTRGEKSRDVKTLEEKMKETFIIDDSWEKNIQIIEMSEEDMVWNKSNELAMEELETREQQRESTLETDLKSDIF
ncbi:uncharacterized protein LOC143356326 [Halictus rubicundus]|uniref:uncharacterized protein LOC143356326 n=1 Tax=Halictus rubicundus TaxID=77578 RepID=UPI0040350830